MTVPLPAPQPAIDARIRLTRHKERILDTPPRRHLHDSGPHQKSSGIVPPPAGVHRYHHVYGVIHEDKKRTLASPMATWMPPACGLEASVGSQLPTNGVGCTWNFDPGPIL